MYVLDTTTLIYFFKGMGSVAATLLEKKPQQISIPAIVLYELEVGIEKSISVVKKRQQLATLTSTVRILPFDTEEVSHAAAIRASLENQGQPIEPYDVLIAGTAMANNGILVTHNTSEFSRIQGLQIEDWY
jgi:tRNA(fMet)-specific endonuclease VapC